MQHAGQADDIRSGVESERYRKAVCQTAGMCRDVLNVFFAFEIFHEIFQFSLSLPY